MNKLKIVLILLMLSVSLAGCYTQFTAADTNGERPERYTYPDSYTDYVPSDSFVAGQTIINNYYGPYSRFFAASGYWGAYGYYGYDPYWYDPFWYDPFWRPGVGYYYYYGGWYPWWYHDHYYPRYPHYYAGNGGSSGSQKPRVSGRLRSSYRSSKSPVTLPEIRPAVMPSNISTRPVQVQTAPQPSGSNTSGSGSSGSSERNVRSEARPSVRTRLIQVPAPRQDGRSGDNGERQRTTNSSGASNESSASRREEPKSYSPPPSQGSETRSSGSAPRSNENQGSGNTSTRRR